MDEKAKAKPESRSTNSVLAAAREEAIRRAESFGRTYQYVRMQEEAAKFAVLKAKMALEEVDAELSQPEPHFLNHASNPLDADAATSVALEALEDAVTRIEIAAELSESAAVRVESAARRIEVAAHCIEGAFDHAEPIIKART